MSAIADRHVTLRLAFTLPETALQVGGWISLEPTLGTHQRWGKAQATDPAGRNYLTISVPKWAAYAVQVDPRGHEIRLTLKDGQALPGDTITLVFGDTAKGGPGWSVAAIPDALEYFIRVCPDPELPKRTYVEAQSYGITEEYEMGSLQPRFGRGARSLKAVRACPGERILKPEEGVMNVPGISIPGLSVNCLMVGPFLQVGPFFERWLLHPYCELVHASEGRATFSVDARNYNLSAGRTLLIKANRPHATRVAAGQSFRGIYIHFAAHSMYHEIERIDAGILAAHRPERDKSLGPFFQRVLDENMDMKRGAPNAADAVLNLILVECFRIGGVAGPEVGQEPAHEKASSLKRISADCSRYINTHFHEPLTLARVAGAIRVSSFYLSHVFSQYMGITFTEYLTDVRMHHARTMLAEADRTIGEIADRIGYSDVYYFSKVFKRYHYLPPGAYRKRLLSGEGIPQPLRGASSA